MVSNELDQIQSEAPVEPADSDQAYHEPSVQEEDGSDVEDGVQIQFTSPTIESVVRKENIFNDMMISLQADIFSPLNEKRFERTWRIGKVAKMVGKTPQLIRLREKEGKLPRPEKLENGRYAEYTLRDINRMRDFFGTRPHRSEEDEAAIVSFSTFKGGCGKTCLSVLCAQHLALKGYRVLMIDCNPQGSATTLFGMNPDLPAADLYELAKDAVEDAAETEEQVGDITQESQDNLNYTIGEYIEGFVREFALVIQGSYFPGIDLVTANMDLGETEYMLAAKIKQKPALIDALRRGVRSVAHDYDIIIMDPPPALGLLSLSVMRAANALVIPMLPTVIDFASTAKFMSMLRSNLERFGANGWEIDYAFETILINGVENSKAHTEIVNGMKTMFPSEDVFTSTMKRTAEIDSATKEMKTVYDLTGPINGHETYNRSISYLDSVFTEVETRIRKTWPSHRNQLRAEAKI